jgi:hypothetical protein
LLCCILVSCTDDSSCVLVESPFAVVVKLESAEFMKEYDAARQFIDVNAVYSGLARHEGITSDSLWRLIVESKFRLGESSRKFTSQFCVHRYDACELMYGDSAEVVFRQSGVTNGSIVGVYGLSRRGASWLVTNIRYNVHRH